MKDLPDTKFDWCEYIGQRICFEQNRSGVLRYYGKIKFYNGFWLGIELDEATGETDGTFNGVRYFTCEDQHGIFIPDSSTINVAAPDKECNEEHIKLGMCEVCVDEKTFNPFQTDKISFVLTEKENLSLNTTYFSKHLMVPMKLPCVLSPLKEESGNYIDISDLNTTAVLKNSCSGDQEILMKTFTLKDNTFNVVNDEKAKDISLTGNDKNNSNLTDTDNSLGILPPALFNDSPSWDYSISDAKVCNENSLSDSADSFSLENTCHQNEKVDFACKTSFTIALNTNNVKEDSVSFSDVNSSVLDCENLPICASTPKHEMIFTNFNGKSMGLDVPKSCSALAVSGDSTLEHKGQVFNFLNVSTVEDFDITFVQPHSEKPFLNTSYDVSNECSKDKLFKPFQGEITTIVPNNAKAVNVENISKSTFDQCTNILNSTFVHQNTVNNSDFVCETNNENDMEHKLNVTTTNNLNKTFRMNEEKITKPKRSSVAINSDSHNSSEFQKINLQCTFNAKHFDCIKESLSNECQKKKDIKLQSKLHNSKNDSYAIKKTTNQPVPNKDRFSLKCAHTRKSSSSKSFRKNNFIKSRQSLSSVSDLKHSVGYSLDDKNEVKCRRSSLSRVENKSYSLLNSTITIPKSITDNLHSRESSKNCSTIPDSVKLRDSIGSGKSVMTSDSSSLCLPNVMDISVFSSEEPVIIKPNGENITVGHTTPTKVFHEGKDSLTFSSEIENKSFHSALNSETCFEMDVRHTDNYVTENVSSEPLITNVPPNTEESCLQLNVPNITRENDECVKNVLNESIVYADSTLASTNELKQSLNALNSLTVTKKGSYKEFANTLNTQNLKADLSTTLCSTSRSEDLSQMIFRKSNAGTFGFSKTAASSMNAQNLGTDLPLTFCSTSKSEDLSKSIVRKSRAGTFGFKTTDKSSSMKNKLPKLFGLASQSETSKIKNSARQSTGSISDSTRCSLGSNFRINSAKTSSDLRKYSLNQKDLPILKNSSSSKSSFVTDSAKVKTSILPSKKVTGPGTSNCVTDSAKSQKAILTSKKVVEAGRSSCVTDSAKSRKTILPPTKVVEGETSNRVFDSAKGQKKILSKKGVEAGTSIYVLDCAKGKKAFLQSTTVLEAGTSKCVTVAKTLKCSQQHMSSALKKESCVVKTSIKCPAVKLTLVNSSKPKPNSINGVCKVNSVAKPVSSKLPSSKNNNEIMPVKNHLRPNIQPTSSSIRSTVFKREDKNAPAPSKGNVQRKSAENSGVAVSNIPKQGLGIPKLFNRASTGCEKNAGNAGAGNLIRKLKSPCLVKKKT